MTNTRTLKPAFATYLRVSSEDKQSPENSFEYQSQRISDAIKRLKLTLPAGRTYSDKLSGQNSQRPGYQQMLSDARESRFSHLGIYSVDRLGRNTQDTLATLQELTDLGVEVIVADSPNLDMETPSGNLLLRMRVIIAQYEVEMLSQRIRDTKHSILLSGGWPFNPPDGFKRIVEE